MKYLTNRKALLAGGFFFLVALGAISCGGSTPDSVSDTIALVQNSGTTADTGFLSEVAKKFYETNPDQYDMLVIWGAPEFAPGHAFYLPVKNDVPGIGYENVGDEFFDNSADYGSQNLQGIIWMGPDWIENTGGGSGPRSVMGILAQETGHRWAATMRYIDPATGESSSALLEDSYHWSTYLNTGASPMGGNLWEALGSSSYQAVPVDYVEFCQLDLYAMGLVGAEEVEPLELLAKTSADSNADSNPEPNVCYNILSDSFSNINTNTPSKRVSQPETIEAVPHTVTIDDIIAAEGRRDPGVGYNAASIRQAWIYVYQNPAQASYTGLDNLGQIQAQWSDFFSAATGGRSTMNTALR